MSFSGLTSTVSSSLRMPVSSTSVISGNSSRSSRRRRPAALRVASSASPWIATEMTGSRGSNLTTRVSSAWSGNSSRGIASIAALTSLTLASRSVTSLVMVTSTRLMPSEIVVSILSMYSMSLMASSMRIEMPCSTSSGVAPGYSVEIITASGSDSGNISRVSVRPVYTPATRMAIISMFTITGFSTLNFGSDIRASSPSSWARPMWHRLPAGRSHRRRTPRSGRSHPWRARPPAGPWPSRLSTPG